MQAIQSYRITIAPEGSKLYYALRHIPKLEQSLILALLSFDYELSQIAVKVSDPSLAQIKLQWWHTETRQFFDGNASHPITRFLQEHKCHETLKHSAFLSRLSAEETNLTQSRFLDTIALSDYTQKGAGSLHTLIAQTLCLNTLDEVTEQRIMALGATLKLTEILCFLGRDTRLGKIYLPINDLQKFQVKAADLLNQNYSEAYYALLENLYQQIVDGYTAWLDYSATLPEALRSFYLALIGLNLKQLHEIRQEKFAVLHQSIELTPLHNFFTLLKTRYFKERYLQKLLALT